MLPEQRDRRPLLARRAASQAHGYSPVWRSLTWNVGCFIVQAGGPLKAAYDVRKMIELGKCEAIAADLVQRARYARHGARYAPRTHAHNRAQRAVEEAFLAASQKD